MSGDRNMEEMHYMNMGFSYNVPETFTGFLDGVSQAPIQYHNNPVQIQDQENAYWSMNMSYYKYGHSSLESTSYHSYETGSDHVSSPDLSERPWDSNHVSRPDLSGRPWDSNHVSRSDLSGRPWDSNHVSRPNHSERHWDSNHVSRPDLSERPWEYAVPMNVHEGVSTDIIYDENQNAIPNEDADTEEYGLMDPYVFGVLSNQDDSNHQDIVEDDIDPDNMTYEELLDLGEIVGTQSRGLSEELINLLPTTKYKSNGIFSRKKSEERCVICQMRYKRGDRQINFPCKHIYHTECGSKWLSINKTCPICNTEVLLDE